ncbi:hypothetical protein QBC43DRAFT_212945 [Cladorrhinum sp. PSN259]|nr:hypothetical protein QBC43DRAFT_212945 [Cladorrhinum sp. PSN259]
MSAPSDRHGRTSPSHDRSQSQSALNTSSSNSRLGIRLVPYTPPRIDPEERAPSQASARPEPPAEDAGNSRPSANYDIQTIRNVGHWRRSSEPVQPRGDESHATTPGSASPTPIASGFSLARLGEERVSGMKPLVSPSGFGQGGPTTTHRRSPSEAATYTTTTNASALRASRSAESPSPSPGQARSLSRRRNIIVLQPDKTFAIVPRNNDRDSAISTSQSPSFSLNSPPTAYSSVRSSTLSTHERPSIDVWTDSRADTPMTGFSTVVPDLVSSSPAPSNASSSTARLVDDPTTSSPWNYRMFGGLRKVPSTPDHSKARPAVEPETSVPPLSPVPETTSSGKDETETGTIVRRPSSTSVVSEVTINTVSESTNYKVYGPGSVGQESNDSLIFNSPGPSNWEVLGDATSPGPAFSFTSPPSPIPEFSLNSSPPETVDGSESENYVVHGGPSVTVSPSSSLVTLGRKPRPSYSQESLKVAPLRPAGKRRSNENFGYYKQRSRESLRSRANSLKTVSSIIGSQNPAQSFLTVAPVVINLGPLTARVARGGGSSSGSSSSSDNFPWLPPPTPGSPAGPSSPSLSIPPVSMIQAHPHQWSSQLSTVMSESEESDPVTTRSVSPLSEFAGGHRRGNSWMSRHSRQMQSISSSLADENVVVYTTSGSESYPTSSSRGGPSQMRTIRDHDEHGDGIADLDSKPSITGLSSMFTNSNGSSRGLHSRSSSRASRASRTRANSLNSSIPAWARVYYGSGERRWLGRSPSFITISEAGSRPGSSGLFPDEESPIDDQFPPAIFSPRKRAREVDQVAQRPYSDQGDMDIEQGYPQNYGVFRTLREKTSSIWSPHLRQDRRASRFSMWDPPSVTWSADTGIMGKRNVQIILFSLGFIFPFAWMIAAVLPLPDLYKLEATEISQGKKPESRFQPRLTDEKRYDSARWWRNLNRIMSIVGLLIIGAVVALAVVGVRQGWGHEE